MKIYDPRQDDDLRLGIGLGNVWSSKESQAFAIEKDGGDFRKRDFIKRVVEAFGAERLRLMVSGLYSRRTRKQLEKSPAEPMGKHGLIIGDVGDSDGLLQAAYDAISHGDGEHWIIAGYRRDTALRLKASECNREWIIDDALHHWDLFDFVLWCNLDMSHLMIFFRDVEQLDAVESLLSSYYDDVPK